jgi:iron complex outermembrane receptor protein
MPEIRISGAKEGASLTQPGVSEARERLNLTPGGVGVVDGQQYREGRVSTISDTLGMAAGVYVQPRFGAEETRLSIRGSGIQRTFHLRGVRIMQDGVPLTLADGGGDFQSIEPLATRYIEVYRGANALQYGSTTLGGAINYVSMTGHDAAPLLARGEFGSFGYARGQLAGGGVAGALDGFASLSTFSQEGFRRHARQNVQRLVANGGYRFSPDLETRFYVGHFDSDSELPGNLTKAQLQADPRQANATTALQHQKRDVDLYRIANRTVYRMGAAQLELFAFYSDKQLFHPIFNVLDQDNQDYGVEVRLVHDGNLGAMPNRLVFGVSPTRGDTDEDRWTNVLGNRGVRTNKFDQRATNFAAYAEDQLTFAPHWTLSLGTQYTRAKRRNTDLCFGACITPAAIAAGAITADESFDLSYSGWSPKIGIRYDWSDAVQLFANVSRSYEPPSFGELTGGNRPVLNKAQRGTTFEIGTRGELPAVGWDVALYHTRLRDELLSYNLPNPLGPAGSTFTTTTNVPRTIHQGLELGAHGAFLKSAAGSADWRGALLVNRFRFDGDPQFGDNTLPGIPKTFLRAEVGYRLASGFAQGLRIAASAEWSPQRYPVDMANTLFADSHTIWGLRLQQQIGRQLSWFVEGRNLSDRKYASATGVILNAGGADSAQFLPGDGRAYYAGLEWKL